MLVQTGRRPLPHLPQLTGVRRADLVLAALAVAVDLVIFTGDRHDGVSWVLTDVSRPWQVVIGLPAVAVLSLRRRWPTSTCLVLSAYAAFQTVLIGSRPLLSLLVALYAAAAGGTPGRSVAALAAVLVAHSTTVTYEATALQGRPGWLLPAAATGFAFLLLDLAAWGFGRRAAVTRDRVDRLEQTRMALAAQAVAEERMRLARELHDIVAHSVTVMVLHAAGAGRIAETEPALAREAMRSVEEIGRQSMAELRRLLTVLRTVAVEPAGRTDGNGNDIRAGLSALDPLVEQIRSVGVPVTVTVNGPGRPLDPSVDLAAFRVVQEALTNVTRHAGPGSSAEVSLTWAGDTLVVEVTDDGSGVPPPSTPGLSSGFGLVGLRERVTLVGGTLRTGNRAGSGFRVTAVLPARAGTDAGAVEVEP